MNIIIINVDEMTEPELKIGIYVEDSEDASISGQTYLSAGAVN